MEREPAFHMQSDRDLLILSLSKLDGLQESLNRVIRRQEAHDESIRSLESRVQSLEHAFSRNVNDLTAARLETDRALREAQGIGKTLDRFQDEQQEWLANFEGQLTVVRWASALAISVIVAVFIAYVTGVLGL